MIRRERRRAGKSRWGWWWHGWPADTPGRFRPPVRTAPGLPEPYHAHPLVARCRCRGFAPCPLPLAGNVLYADAGSCKRAMVGNGRPLPPTEGSSGEGLDPTDLASLPWLWHQGRDFIKAGAEIKLVYRMATVDDVRDLSAPKTTRELWKVGGPSEPGRQRNVRAWVFGMCTRVAGAVGGA